MRVDHGRGSGVERDAATAYLRGISVEVAPVDDDVVRKARRRSVR
jgi:hypothetical protein